VGLTVTDVARTPAVLVAEACEHASLPELVVQINLMADDQRHTADDIGALIGQDPALVARLLRLTNSPWFGLSNRVSTVLQAIRTIAPNRCATWCWPVAPCKASRN